MKAYLAEQQDGESHSVVANPRYRPFIGISVSKRVLPLEQTVKILSWLLHSPSPVLPILIADEIAVINYKAFKRYSGGSCVKKVQQDSDLQISHWQQAADCLPPEQSRRIRFVRWSEIVTDLYGRQVALVRSEFEQNPLLQDTILALVTSFIRSTGKTVTTQRCWALAEYIIQELPSLLFGIEVDTIQYQLLVYPTHYPTEMYRLVIAIRRHPAFAEFFTQLQNPPLENNKIIQLIITGQRFDKPSHPLVTPSHYDRAAHELTITA
jgi:tRNA-dependent cyclodipeptide synthase